MWIIVLFVQFPAVAATRHLSIHTRIGNVWFHASPSSAKIPVLAPEQFPAVSGASEGQDACVSSVASRLQSGVGNELDILRQRCDIRSPGEETLPHLIWTIFELYPRRSFRLGIDSQAILPDANGHLVAGTGFRYVTASPDTRPGGAIGCAATMQTDSVPASTSSVRTVWGLRDRRA